ncbi:MAG: sigma-70 family RNA polymerase sigma factor [Candidatus Omnitrophica bacterium]|nr:sigma-70 family RNA polymerase sigma factor [Candidatus Omnitrophota bacterium]
MNDLEFVRRCASGDKLAWDEFVDKYSRLIYNYIHSVFKVKGFASARENIDDLFQEIFLSLTQDNFKRLKTFKGKNGCSLASWLRQVTINRTIDYIRRLKPAISIDAENDDGLSLKDMLVDGSAPAFDSVAQAETMINLADCIEKLAQDDKYFLELHINQQLNLEELKSHLGVSRGAVDMRKSRILERLKECFKGKGLLLDF